MELNVVHRYIRLYMVADSLKKKIILHSHYYYYYYFYYFCISFSFLRVSLLTASPSLLSSFRPSFFLHRSIADLHEPSCSRASGEASHLDAVQIGQALRAMADIDREKAYEEKSGDQHHHDYRH